ncbi:MAG TPA: Asp23/Gls24 family envelope stress response protein [Halanaerobiales bacterium]|nr:Asp23/Gls24 family envelope stress response protein [Halanaerobiales bacterium]
MENKKSEELGTIKIANEVVAIISGLAATEVEGVAGMSGGIAGGIADMLGRKNLSKGVKVEVGDSETSVDIFVIVDYGSSIPDVAWNIQDNVRKAIESMTGLNAVEINVHVQGVDFESEEEIEENEEE